MSHDVNYQEDLDTSILIEGKQKWEDSETPEVPETPETIPPQKPDTPAPQKPQTQQPQNLPTKKPAQPVKTGDTSEISLTLLMLALSTSAIGLLRKRR